ncbi:hypothetical protein Tola_1226 [Tolumonas auensis DSM 9187]|uniref:Uncharacterized protein n=1 Tax=Tolumonas auensis (strain DSM 9187 / NBRC 110442 / TA 4) TaxID=595494 RepID=C4LE22_TOLAT|nr:hypothetical protein Tola_1226 [Tolumonas auensis DSM 9187]
MQVPGKLLRELDDVFAVLPGAYRLKVITANFSGSEE